MRKVVVLFFLSLLTVSLFAQPVDKKDILKVAGNFLKETKAIKDPSVDDIKVEKFAENDTTLLYLTHNKGDFVILSNDLRVKPILGYSTEGSYDGTNYPPQFKALIKSYKEQILKVKRGEIKTDQFYAKEWDKSISGNFTKAETVVDPIIDVEWDQGNSWNRFCPEDEDGPGGHVYVGCVAVAMGQAMSVYEHPEQGVGESSCYSDYGALSVNHGETEYKWNLMSSTSANDYNSLLLYHLAVSVDMNFSPDGSGAYTSDAANAMKDHFDYDATYKTSTDDEAWRELLKSEIDAGRPVIYAGNNGSDAGHAFNLDGYNGNVFHVNWGWSGSYNGNFSLDALDPNGSDYSKNAKAVIGIEPKDHSPTGINLSSTSFIDTVSPGTVVSIMNTEDPDPDDNFEYTVSEIEGRFDTTYCPFYTKNDSLILTEKVSNKDYKELEVLISTEDSQGNVFEKKFIIDVLKENYPPSDIKLSETALYDTISKGGYIATFSTVDPDEIDTFTYTLENSDSIGEDNDKFFISADSLFSDYDFSEYAGDSLSIFVKSADRKSETVTREFLLEVEQPEMETSSKDLDNIALHSSSVYPNPTKGILNFDYEERTIKKIMFFNSNGNLIKHERPHSRKWRGDISKFAPGTYIVRIYFNSGKTEVYKILKQ